MVPSVFLVDEQAESGEKILESKLRQLVSNSRIPEDVCSVIRSQIERKITETMETVLSMPFLFFTVQCHGTYLNGTALHSDEVRVLLVHQTLSSDDDIIRSLKACGSFSHLAQRKGVTD